MTSWRPAGAPREVHGNLPLTRMTKVERVVAIRVHLVQFDGCSHLRLAERCTMQCQCDLATLLTAGHHRLDKRSDALVRQWVVVQCDLLQM